MSYGKILSVEAGSLAEELELVPGDKIVEVNGMKLRDIIDLSFAFADEEIELLIEHEDGEQELLEFDKDYDEELGVEFESAVFDGIRRCANNCYFCFVDQVAPDMRESLNIKDDDYRMSFLYGNFITMTNMGENDFKRIEQYHLSPLFVSVQCTNPELRCQMLRCKTAGNLAAQLDRLAKADVEYHTQIVLCRDLNDGAELDRSIRDILARKPHALSMAIVPVGLTKFRQDQYPLQGFDRESAARVIEQVEVFQQQERKATGRTFVYLGDEFYFLAGKEVPPAENYDGFPQLDNGIGLARNFMEEFAAAKEKAGETALTGYEQDVHLAVVTGTAVAPMFEQLAGQLSLNNLKVTVVPVPNRHFGTTVNVSGLLTAHDMRTTLEETVNTSSDNFDGILIPESCLRVGDNIFLDDVTLEEFSGWFDGRVETVSGGGDYFRALTNFSGYQGVSGEEAVYMWQSNAAYTKKGGYKNE
ncbi:MAG: DUF512 domain-containing protein [Anaerovibrio sp.]|uniref:DUF512 domain-containing protein n=1 Tax=Anaerovibrio sp. TaxID=1872532 RepID=UPI0025C26914|nr:DUF512 domain-containing protein [Anaerovibrio sp.]MBE6098662.1 DUF512 domain-containing protein [Anaerovibrio sp.]